MEEVEEVAKSRKPNKVGTIESYVHFVERPKETYPQGTCQECGKVHEPEETFYVSAIRGEQHTILLGPYTTHAAAVANVQRGMQMAHDTYSDTDGAAFGTCSTRGGEALESRLGV